MKLPNASAARVDTEKVLDYLLSDSHPIGRSKAEFFRGLGFARHRPEELEAAILKIAHAEPVVDQERTRFGTKYVIDGRIAGPKSSARVRTVWFREQDAAAPRLVTAYPAPREEA